VPIFQSLSHSDNCAIGFSRSYQHLRPFQSRKCHTCDYADQWPGDEIERKSKRIEDFQRADRDGDALKLDKPLYPPEYPEISRHNQYQAKRGFEQQKLSPMQFDG